MPRYVPLTLELLRAHQNWPVVWVKKDGEIVGLRDLRYFRLSRRSEEQFAATDSEGDSFFFGAHDLAFELPDLPKDDVTHYDVIESTNGGAQCWYAAAMDSHERILAVLFTGPNAAERASEYADWKNGLLAPKETH
jgi:hypothetical protein